MGVRGAALATIISQCVSALWVLKFLTGKKTTLKIRFSNMKLSGQILLPVLALGLSPFIMQSTESLLSICFNTSLQKYGGDLAVGSMTILTSIMQILSLPLSGLTQGAQPIISYNFGAGNKERVKQAFRLLFISCVTFASLYWLLNMLYPQLLVSIFARDDALKAMAAWALRIYLAAGFMMGIQLACQQTFVAIGQAKISLFLALLRKIILLIPLIYILPTSLQTRYLQYSWRNRFPILSPPPPPLPSSAEGSIRYSTNANPCWNTNEPCSKYVLKNRSGWNYFITPPPSLAIM